MVIDNIKSYELHAKLIALSELLRVSSVTDSGHE